MSWKSLTGLFVNFRGELARRRFAVAWVSINAATVVVAAIAKPLIPLAADRLPLLFALGAIVIAVLIGYVWSLFAIMAKRVRSIGLPPAPVLAGFVMVELLDLQLLTHMLRARFYWPLDANTPIGGAAVAIFGVVLALWPGRSAPAAAEPPVEAAGPEDVEMVSAN